MAKAKNKKLNQQEVDILVVTQQGYEDMLQELNNRKEKVRLEIAEEISVARDLGDLSENQAYSDAMERKEMNDKRIDELEYLLSIAKVSEIEREENVVTIGHKVEIRKRGGDKKVVMLVGKEESMEADPQAGKISVDSPVGKALNLAKVGDIVTVTLVNGDVVEYEVLGLVS